MIKAIECGFVIRPAGLINLYVVPHNQAPVQWKLSRKPDPPCHANMFLKVYTGLVFKFLFKLAIVKRKHKFPNNPGKLKV